MHGTLPPSVVEIRVDVEDEEGPAVPEVGLERSSEPTSGGGSYRWTVNGMKWAVWKHWEQGVDSR